MLARIYVCPQCGDVTNVTTAREFDINNDECYEWLVCCTCTREVKEKIHTTESGEKLPCYTEVEEPFFYDDEYMDRDDDYINEW